MFIFYHEDKAMENSVKHFKTAKCNRYRVGELCFFFHLILGLSPIKY